MRTKKKWLCLIVTLSFFFVAGFQSNAVAKEKPIYFGYLTCDQIHEPCPMIMKAKKFLEAEGLKVKWGEFLAGSYVMQHMASGEVDIATCGAVPSLITRGAGVDIVILADSNTDGSRLVVKNSIKTPKDLDGKLIGTPGLGSIQDALLDMIAEKYKIKIVHKHMKVSDMPIFFNKGEIDGFIAWEPHPSRAAIGMGLGHYLLSSQDILPGHQCCVLVARGDFVRKNPDKIRKIMRAYMRAEGFLITNPEESKKMMVKYTMLSREVVDSAAECVTHAYPPFLDRASMKLMTEGLIKSGKIQHKNLDVDKFVNDAIDESFLREFLTNPCK